jgi:hypothetical protein
MGDVHVEWLLTLEPNQFYKWHRDRDKGEVVQSLVATLDVLRAERAAVSPPKGDAENDAASGNRPGQTENSESEPSRPQAATASPSEGARLAWITQAVDDFVTARGAVSGSEKVEALSALRGILHGCEADVTAFLEGVRAEERERCARLVESLHDSVLVPHEKQGKHYVSNRIRSLGAASPPLGESPPKGEADA